MEDNFWKIFLSRPYHFKLFKDCLPQNLLSPLLNTLSHLLSDAYLGSCQTSMMEDKYPINKPIINIRPNPIKGSGTEVGFQQRCLMVSLLDFARCETWSIHYHFRNFFSDCTCNMISKWFSGMSYGNVRNILEQLHQNPWRVLHLVSQSLYLQTKFCRFLSNEIS